MYCPAPIDNRLMVDELPYIRIERPELFLNVEELSRVGNCRKYFEAVSDNSGITEELGYTPFGVLRYLAGIKLIESFSVMLPFAEHGVPAKSRLRGFQCQEFKEHTIFMHRDAPLLIVICNVIWLCEVHPGTTRESRIPWFHREGLWAFACRGGTRRKGSKEPQHCNRCRMDVECLDLLIVFHVPFLTNMVACVDAS